MKKTFFRVLITVLCVGAVLFMGAGTFYLLFGEKPILEGTLGESIPQPWQDIVGALVLIVVLIFMIIVAGRIIKKAFSMENPQDLFQRD